MQTFLAKNLIYIFSEPLLSLSIAVVAQTCSARKLFLEMSQNSQENTCARVFIKTAALASGLQFY